MISNMCFIYKKLSKGVKEALKDELCFNDMHKELVQFYANEVWELVPRLNSANIIDNK